MRARPARIAGIVLGAVVAFVLVAAMTASNTVPASRLGRTTQAITPNAVKPAACSAITVTTLVTGSGTFSGTSAANLVLGSAAVDTVTALGGTDCVLGGGGNDSLNGGAGNDVCIGGPGTDTFTACETAIQ